MAPVLLLRGILSSEPRMYNKHVQLASDNRRGALMHIKLTQRNVRHLRL